MVIEVLTFEAVTEITTHPLMIVASIIVWAIPMMIYIIVGAFQKFKGKYIDSQRMIEYPNFWWAVAIWTFIYWGLYLIMIFYPFWLEWF